MAWLSAPELAIQACNELLGTDPLNASAHFIRGNAHFRKGHTDRAIADFSEAIRLDPRNRDVDPDTGNLRNAAVHRNRGFAYTHKNDPSRAIKDLNEALRLNPRDDLAYSYRGQVWQAVGDRTKAVDDYKAAISFASKKETIDLERQRLAALGVEAGPYEDCSLRGPKEADLAIRACTDLIRRNPQDVGALVSRGKAYRWKNDCDRAAADYGEVIRIEASARAYKERADIYRSCKQDWDRAIADYTDAVRLMPGDSEAYFSRSLAYRSKGDYDQAIADCSKVMSLRSSRHACLGFRADLYAKKGDYDRAIADYSEEIKLASTSGRSGRRGARRRRFALYWTYLRRGELYAKKGDYQRAIADATEAIQQDETKPHAYHARGELLRATKQYDQAIGDLDKAIALDPKYVPGLASRGKVYEEKGERAKAVEAYGKIVALDAKTTEAKDYQAKAAQWLAALQAGEGAPALARPKFAATPPGRRVALVIGHSAYRAVSALRNPRKDARDVAAALRDAGFSEVVERYDLGIAAMRSTLSAFEDMARTADWAVVYYAGHGIEVDGRNFLVPIDAQLRRDSDVEDETLPLERVLARVSVAKKLQLVILDACRDNSFARRMAPSGGITRSIGTRGLARVEYALPNLMIAYSARAGEAALDGPPGGNSPYAKALVKYLAEPGLELSIFFRKVRGDVLAATNSKQRPFEDSSLTDVNLFFRNAAR